MANSKKPRKRKNSKMPNEKLKTIHYMQSKLQDLCIGAIQAGKHYQYTHYNGKEVDSLPISAQEAIKHIKFSWSMIFGVIHRKKDGIPKIEYLLFECTKEYYLYSDEFSNFVFNNLKRLYDSANNETKLTTFWLASPNKNYDSSLLMARVISMLDKHKVYTIFKNNYEWDNDITPNQSLHNTTCWYGLIDWVELNDFELIA